MWAEDVDLSRRIRDAGWKLYYDAEATIIHHVGGSAKKGATNFHTLMKCESHHKLMVKYYGAVGGVLYKGAIMIGSLIRLFVVFSINLFRKASNRKAPVDIRKYRSMILWVLGREKPVIKS
jgi:GT2 family glycosyltransferase